jgi:hypothetical protein
MQKVLVDSFVVGLTTVAVGSGASILSANNAVIAIASSGMGATVSSTILLKRKAQISSLKNQSLQSLQPFSSTPQTEVVVQPESSGENTIALEQQTQLKKALHPESLEQSLISNEDICGSKAIQAHNNDDKLINNWLSTKNVSVEDSRIPDVYADEIFDKQATYIGKNLSNQVNDSSLMPLLKQIKWTISTNRKLQYHLKNSTQQQIQTITRFCHNLHKDTLLSSYYYDKERKVIHAAVQDRGDIRKFFNGEWFERFIFQQISETLQHLELSYTYLINPFIRLTNGDGFELDLLFLVGEKPLLVECKTGGDFNIHLKKFSDHCKRLSIPPERALITMLDLEDAQTEKLSQFWKFRIANQNNVIPVIQGILNNNGA